MTSFQLSSQSTLLVTLHLRCLRATIDFHLKTIDGNSFPVHAQILKECTGHIPVARIDLSKLPEIAGKTLADPDFHTPKPVDMILGIELFNSLMLSERIKCGRIVMTETRVGWMLSGVADIADAGLSTHAADPFHTPSSCATLQAAPLDHNS